MKHISRLLPFFLIFAVSCQKQIVTDQLSVSGGEIRTVTVSLDTHGTKAVSSASGEDVINDAMVFVWQRNKATGTEVLYGKTYEESASFGFDLLFSNGIDYIYRFDVFANMGELDAVPEDGDVLFSSEKETSFQMVGSSGEIDREGSSSVNVDMKRFVGKITVGSVSLKWLNKINSFSDFILKSVYVANAGNDASGTLAGFNDVEGVYQSSEMDCFLYCPISSIIPDGGVYDTPQHMYSYGSGTTEIVLECELDGQAMYYHVPYEPDRNSHCVFDFIIHQKGADEPLGALPDEAVEVYVSSVNVFEWVENIHGSELEPVPVES